MRFIRDHVGHPWMQAGACADEALLLTARVLGTFACAAYASSVKSHSSASSPGCVVQDDLLLYASKTIGVSLLAIMGGSLATSVLASIGRRPSTRRNVMMWLLVWAYICCCLLFCATLIANVLESDLLEWSLRVSWSFIKMMVAFPLAQALAAHRMYYQCLQDKDEVQELRRKLYLDKDKDGDEVQKQRSKLHLESAGSRGWEEPSPPSPAPPTPLPPRPLAPAETPPS